MPSVTEILDTMDYGPAPEANGHVLDWLKAHEQGFGHFINGAFSKPAKLFDVANPATGQPLARVSVGSAADVDAAVRAARKAFGPWSKLPGHERAKHLYAIARTVQKRERFLSVLETMDNGKPIRESRDIDIPLVARHFYHHAGWAELIADEFPGHQPVGVCGQIIPWNFPLLMLAWKIAPALAAGNTVVLKPAEFTPLTALAFAEICREAGLPPGVVNIVTGDGATGAALVEHADVDKIAFTGSTEVGRLIRRATAGTGKKLSLELGGKSPVIVCADADLEKAVPVAAMAAFANSGQICIAGSRLFVERPIYEEMLERLSAFARTLRIGDGADPQTEIGPLVSEKQLRRVEGFLESGQSEGARLVVGGRRPRDAALSSGHFVEPTVFANVSDNMQIAREEIFGPVISSLPFDSLEDVIKRANATPYGLAAGVFTRDVGKAHRISAALRAGSVWVNTYHVLDPAVPFGGYKMSGYGREGGAEHLDEYLNTKSVWLRLD